MSDLPRKNRYCYPKGKDIGRNEGGKSLMIRMLTRKLGKIDPNSIDLINSLSLESLA